MTGQAKLFGLLEPLLKKSEAEQTEIVVIKTSSGVTRYANSFIHQNMFENNCRVYFRVALGKKLGVASTNSLEKESLKSVLESAIEIASNQKENPDFDSFSEKQKYTRVKTYFKSTANYTPRQRAQEVKKAFDKASRHNLTVAGSFSTGEAEIAVLNSLGVRCYQPLTSASINLIAMSDDSSGYADGLSRRIDEIDVSSLAEVAIQKCLDSRHPKLSEPGEYDVILEPSAVAALLEWMNYIGFGSKSYQEGTSFLSGRIGQKIMGDYITLYDDGKDESGVAFPFDFEGVPKKKVVFVDKGLAKGVVYDSLTANRDKVRSTGHALTPDSAEGALSLNLFMKGGGSSLPRMVASLERGILVTRFHYINGFLDTKQALMTGMTRDGTFWIENGKVKHGIKNLRFTESMLRAFSNVAQLSRQRKLVNAWWGDVGCISAPAVLIKNFKFTGKTEF